jgi:hypothetical protein
VYLLRALGSATDATAMFRFGWTVAMTGAQRTGLRIGTDVRGPSQSQSHFAVSIWLLRMSALLTFLFSSYQRHHHVLFPMIFTIQRISASSLTAPPSAAASALASAFALFVEAAVDMDTAVATAAVADFSAMSAFTRYSWNSSRSNASM